MVKKLTRMRLYMKIFKKLTIALILGMSALSAFDFSNYPNTRDPKLIKQYIKQQLTPEFEQKLGAEQAHPQTVQWVHDALALMGKKNFAKVAVRKFANAESTEEMRGCTTVTGIWLDDSLFAYERKYCAYHESGHYISGHVKFNKNNLFIENGTLMYYNSEEGCYATKNLLSEREREADQKALQVLLKSGDFDTVGRAYLDYYIWGLPYKASPKNEYPNTKRKSLYLKSILRQYSNLLPKEVKKLTLHNKLNLVLLPQSAADQGLVEELYIHILWVISLLFAFCMTFGMTNKPNATFVRIIILLLSVAIFNKKSTRIFVSRYYKVVNTKMTLAKKGLLNPTRQYNQMQKLA